MFFCKKHHIHSICIPLRSNWRQSGPQKYKLFNNLKLGLDPKPFTRVWVWLPTITGHRLKLGDNCGGPPETYNYMNLTNFLWNKYFLFRYWTGMHIPTTTNGEKHLWESGILGFLVKTCTDDGVAVAWQGPFSQNQVQHVPRFSGVSFAVFLSKFMTITDDGVAVAWQGPFFSRNNMSLDFLSCAFGFFVKIASNSWQLVAISGNE